MDEAALQRLVSRHFSLDNLRQANELILDFTCQLRLREVFRFSPDMLHSSSDGQKYDLAVESLGGSASFKYFGNRWGLTAYSYVDETHSTVFSAADHEATHPLRWTDCCATLCGPPTYTAPTRTATWKSSSP